MPATIIGSPASGGKVLRRQNYAKETNGLETIQETYIVRSADLISLVPAKDTTHFAYSSATTKFRRMAVESTSTSEQDGGISELNVTYVGLTSSSGLPPAIVRTIPLAGAAIYGAPVIIDVEFVSDSSVTQILAGKLSSLSTAPSEFPAPIPPQINGTAMPTNPKTPFTNRANLANLTTGQIFAGAGGIIFQYYGYCLKETQATQRGQFIVAVLSYQEFGRTGQGTSSW